jgi:hypothetical protein
MIKGGKSKPGAVPGTRAHGPGRRRCQWATREMPFSLGRRSSGGYGLPGPAVLAILGILGLGMVGCGAQVSGYGQIDGSPDSFVANVRPSPGETSQLLRNAYYYKLMGRPDLALKELAQAHQRDPDNLKLVNSLAQSYEELGKFEAARELYQEALTRHGPQPVLANNLCFTYYLEGSWQEAESCYRQTLARDPGNVAARNNLGLLYCRLGRRDEARRLWQEGEGEAAAEVKMGQALAALGISKGAVYAQRPEPSPPAARVSSAPTPVATPSRPLASLPSQVHTPTPPPVAPTKTEGQLAAIPAAESPISHRAKPQKEAEAQPAVPEKASPAAAARPTPPAATPPRQASLTCAELVDTAIEIRNGTWTHNLAHETRTLLSLEGFTVTRIGNHIDFGATKTIIYYRPGAERVARAVGSTFFPGAGLEPSLKLKQDVDVKILLGADLLKRPQLMARLAGEE